MKRCWDARPTHSAPRNVVRLIWLTLQTNLHEEGRTRLAGETERARAFAVSPAADNPLRYRRFRETCGCHGSFLAFSQGLLIKFRNDFMEQLIPVHLHLQAHED